MQDKIVTLAEHVFIKFIEHQKNIGRKDETIRTYRSAYKALFYDKINNNQCNLKQLSAVCFYNWKELAINSKAKPSTINQRLAFLRMFLIWAKNSGYIATEVIEPILRIRDAPTTKLSPKALQEDELRRLVSFVEISSNVRNQSIFFLLLNGLRVGEVCGLNNDDVHINHHRGHLEIRGTHVKFSSSRQVPLNRQARYYLAKYIETTRPSYMVFIGERGPISVDGVFKMIKKLGMQVGISLHPHMLRHTFARKYLADNSNDLVGLQMCLGHADIQTTSKYYCRKSLTDLQNSVDNIKM